MADTAKHTAGPWSAVFNRKDDNGAEVCSIYDNKNDAETGYISDVYRGHVGSMMSDEEYRSNALLIAAAPELLGDGQFLLDRLAEFERELEDDQVAREFYGHVSPAIARFSAAIAKTEGV